MPEVSTFYFSYLHDLIVCQTKLEYVNRFNFIKFKSVCNRLPIEIKYKVY